MAAHDGCGAHPRSFADAALGVAARRLQPPGPNPDELDAILQAGLRAPDHGGLHPWRVIEFRPQNREALAWYFEQEKLRRDPLASPPT